MTGPLEADTRELWTVWRHSGRRLSSPWRLLYSGNDENKARLIYESQRARLVFGGLRLLDPVGRDQASAFGRVEVSLCR